jgi:hypothetical protein
MEVKMSIEKLIHNNQEWEKFNDEEETYYITLNDGRYDLLNEKGQRLDKMDYNSTYKAGKNILDKKILDKKDNVSINIKEKKEIVEEKEKSNEFENIQSIYKYIQNKYKINLNVISKKIPNTENDKYNLILIGNKVIGETFKNSKTIKSHCSIEELDEISNKYVSNEKEKNKVELEKDGVLNIEEIKKLSVNEIKKIIEDKIKKNELLKKTKEELLKKIEKEKQEIEILKLKLEEGKKLNKNNSTDKINTNTKEGLYETLYKNINNNSSEIEIKTEVESKEKQSEGFVDNQKKENKIEDSEEGLYSTLYKDINNDSSEIEIKTEDKSKEEKTSKEVVEKIESINNEVSMDSLLKLNDKNKELLKQSAITNEDTKLSSIKPNNNSNNNLKKEDTKTSKNDDKKEVKTSKNKQR